jgi:hypothetical protein
MSSFQRGIDASADENTSATVARSRRRTRHNSRDACPWSVKFVMCASLADKAALREKAIIEADLSVRRIHFKHCIE